MATKEREGELLEYLKAHGEATVGELSAALFVSEPTVRRDLAALAAEGKLRRTHGGAVLLAAPGENLPQALREREQSEAKQTIGRKCLSLIPEGATVMVDGSSTAMALLTAVAREGRSFVVVTNSATAPLLLADTAARVFVSGGELARGTHAYVGSHAEEFLRSFNADICFFSVRTLTRDGRLTDNAIAENAVRRVMMAASRESVLLLDSGKIGTPCLSTLCHLRDVTHVVSERDISLLFPDFSDKFI